MSISPELRDRLLTTARKNLPAQIRWRRHLHQYPELSLLEFKTTAFLKEQVKGMGLRILPLKMKTGLLAELKGARPGPTVAIRTDIDALPVTELTGLSYKSKINGHMHACGHDAHMAIVLGTAALLKEFRADLPGNVRFIFQPAEEQPPGGARPMIAGGALKNVSMIFALHVDPLLPTGKIGLRDGASMASVTDLDLIIRGKGGHAARPHEAIDAIVVAAEVIDSIQKVISREIDPIEPAVITFGRIEGGTARNTICDKVTLTGTARALSTAASRKLRTLIERTASNVCRARGAKLDITPVADYPVLYNDPATNKILADTFGVLFSKRHIAKTELVLGGEDFACYLQKVPGAMFRLGVMNKRLKADQPWHSPKFIIDEEGIFYGTALMAAAAISYLKGKSR